VRLHHRLDRAGRPPRGGPAHDPRKRLPADPVGTDRSARGLRGGQGDIWDHSPPDRRRAGLHARHADLVRPRPRLGAGAVPPLPRPPRRLAHHVARGGRERDAVVPPLRPRRRLPGPPRAHGSHPHLRACWPVGDVVPVLPGLHRRGQRPLDRDPRRRGLLAGGQLRGRGALGEPCLHLRRRGDRGAVPLPRRPGPHEAPPRL
ncbi:MAG: hypothetical protein AVDCRST_MAG15-1964, partial [uncultured Rubellimicrobium sp.]